MNSVSSFLSVNGETSILQSDKMIAWFLYKTTAVEEKFTSTASQNDKTQYD